MRCIRRFLNRRRIIGRIGKVDMAKFIKNRGLVQKIVDVIEEADDFVFIVCPFYKIPKDELLALQEADKKNVKINLIYSKSELHRNDISKLSGIRNLHVYYIENLHAKCYANEKEVIVSTMNMHEYSFKHNIEMGVLFGKRYDEDNYSKALRELQRIQSRSIKQSVKALESGMLKMVNDNLNPVNIVKRTYGYVERKMDRQHHGYCIRTGAKIEFDIDRPFSKDAYYEWREYMNADYPEKYCHFSGERSNGETSMNYPIARKNWEKACRIYKLNAF